jgi:uncharacterized phage protein gp47/JayE
MACLLTKPDAQELWSKIEAQFSADVLGGGNIIPESNEWYLVNLDFAVRNEFYSIAEQMWRERDPRYACCDNLIAMAALDGIYPKPAGFSQGYVRLTGTSGTILSQDMQIEINGENYVPAGTSLGLINSDGFAILRVKAIEAGSNGNASPGATGTILNPPDGINAEVTLYGSFCGGSPAEDCDTFRVRYIDRIKYKPSANLDWIKQKVAEWPCVTNVCERGSACCELDEDNNVICPDTFHLYVMMQGTFECGLAPQCVIDEMNAWLNGENPGYGQGQLPFGICGTIDYVQGAYIDIVIDGAACATEAQRTEIQSRIRDFVSNTCPSENLILNQINLIIAQIIGNTSDLSVSIRDYSDDTHSAEGIRIDTCGDVNVDCGYKVCLHNIEFVNLNQTTSGCL